MRSHTHKKQLGFTLIELLIVIGIMGVLFALAIPSFRSYERNLSVKNAAKDLRSLLWEAQGYGLAPQDPDILRYQVRITKGVAVGPRVDIRAIRKNSSAPGTCEYAPTPVTSVTLNNVRLENFTAANNTTPIALSGNSIAFDFVVGNVDGGKIVILDPGPASSAPSCAPAPVATTANIVLSSSTASFAYKVVVNAGNNTIDFDKN